MKIFSTSSSQEEIIIRGNYNDGGSYYYPDHPFLSEDKCRELAGIKPRFIVCQWCARRNPLDSCYCDACGGPL